MRQELSRLNKINIYWGSFLTILFLTGDTVTQIMMRLIRQFLWLEVREADQVKMLGVRVMAGSAPGCWPSWWPSPDVVR